LPLICLAGPICWVAVGKLLGCKTNYLRTTQDTQWERCNLWASKTSTLFQTQRPYKVNEPIANTNGSKPIVDKIYNGGVHSRFEMCISNRILSTMTHLPYTSSVGHNFSTKVIQLMICQVWSSLELYELYMCLVKCTLQEFFWHALGCFKLGLS